MEFEPKAETTVITVDPAPKSVVGFNNSQFPENVYNKPEDDPDALFRWHEDRGEISLPNLATPIADTLANGNKVIKAAISPVTLPTGSMQDMGL